MVWRADRTSSGRRAAPRVVGLVAGIALLLNPVPPLLAQDLAFPGGVIWQVSFDPPPAQVPAFDRHSAYLVLRDGHVRAVDHATGDTRWTAPAASSVRPASSGQLLVGADGAAAWAIDAVSGRGAWRRDLGASVAASPVVAPSGALFVTERDDLVLLAWADGREVWRARMPAHVSAPVAAGADAVWAGLDDGRVFALGLADGVVKWTRALGARILGMTPVGNTLYAGAADDFLYALKVKNGGVDWRWRTGGDVVGHAVADARRLYFTSLDAMLRAVDLRHGDLRWQRPLATRAVGELALADTLVIVAGVSPELRAFRTRDGGMEAFTPLPGRPLHGPYLAPATASAPVRLVVLTAGGRLMALGRTVEPMLVPLDVLPGRTLPPEVLPVIKR